MEEATKLMADHFQLSKRQVVMDLRRIDLSRSVVSEICPSFLQPVRCPVNKYRTLSGMCNNLVHPSWASARSAMVRYIPPAYMDGISRPRELGVGGNALPPPRVLSVALHDGENRLDLSITVMLATWGQVVTHDINFGSPTFDEKGMPVMCCGKTKADAHPACYSMDVPRSDYFYRYFNRSCQNFVRLTPSLRPACPLGPREPMNLVSGYIDGSLIYGSTSDMTAHLREMKNGRLRSYKLYQDLGLKDLLPQQVSERRTSKFMTINSLQLNRPDFLCQRHGRPSDVFCFEGGDLRSNQQLPLTLMHTILMREHNRIADFLTQFVPGIDDNTAFEEARRLVIAEMQLITYREFLPVVLGEPLMHKYGLTLLVSR